MASLNNPVRLELDVGGRPLTLETGRMAKQADGSVYIRYGDTSALVTAVSSSKINEAASFFPLTIEIQEKFYSAGRIPGGFFKKEARPSEWATLNARLVDRPLRPLFPEGYKAETQVVVTLLSYDNQNELEAIAGLGASAAIMVSDIPFDHPIATVRVGRVDGNFVLNPTPEQQEKADINVLVSSSEEALVMVEGGAEFASEEDFLDALYFGFDAAQPLIKAQKELQEKIGKTKRSFTSPARNEKLASDIKSLGSEKLREAFQERNKLERYAKIDAIKDEVSKKILEGEIPDASWDEELFQAKISEYWGDLKSDIARDLTLNTGSRLDGRSYKDIRPIETEISTLPRVHGSSLFTRGETQALGVVTLGTNEDEQMIDSVKGKYTKKFLLHYNFPPYSVGETGRFGGNSRREIGHGMLAERGVTPVLPSFDDFGYTIRMVSEVFESNGSSSMATVCASSLAMMDAGVPLKEPVAGIAMGLMQYDGKVVVLSDILGDEDHLGDMDFKVVGTKTGLTAVQMDIKMKGISKEILQDAMAQAKEGRMHILGEMEKTISTHKSELSPLAPKFNKIQISQERIKDLIGPGGKNIKNIVAVTGVKIDIDDAGVVSIASSDPEAAAKAVEMVKELTEEAEVGKIYMGTVVKVADYGAFVEIMPGTSGLCHISELDKERVGSVSDICQEGDQIPVKVLEIDRQGKIRLSRKSALD